ncbi:MAG: hypothetical protein R6X13_07110 [bacterium]
MTASEAWKRVASSSVAVAAVLTLAAPTAVVALGVPTIPEVVSNHLQIGTPLDDLFSGMMQHGRDPLAALQALNRDYEVGKQRLAAAFGRQRLIVTNFPFLSDEQKEQSLRRLNDSYERRLSELTRRFDSERAKLAGCMF